MVNYYERLANIFSLELGDDFYMKNKDGVDENYMFFDNGLFKWSEDEKIWIPSNDSIIRMLDGDEITRAEYETPPFKCSVVMFNRPVNGSVFFLPYNIVPLKDDNRIDFSFMTSIYQKDDIPKRIKIQLTHLGSGKVLPDIATINTNPNSEGQYYRHVLTDVPVPMPGKYSLDAVSQGAVLDRFEFEIIEER